MSKSLAKVKSDIREELLTDFQDKDYAHGYIEDFLNTEIATQIRVLREQNELTQSKLGELTDMEQSRISLLEDVFYEGWTIKTLKKLAYAFDVTLKVSFETFTDRIEDVLNLSRESLKREPREKDLASYTDFSEFAVNIEEIQQVWSEPIEKVAIVEPQVFMAKHLEETKDSVSRTEWDEDLAA